MKARAKGAGKGSKKGLSQKARGKQRAIEQEQQPAIDGEPPALEEGPPPPFEAQLDHAPPQHIQEQESNGSITSSQASTSNSPRIHAFDSIQASQSPSMSLLFGGSSHLLDQPLPPSTQEEHLLLPTRRKGSTPIFPSQSPEELVAMHFSPSSRSTGLASAAETARVPDSQEKNRPEDTTIIDTSALTDLSKLTDLSNASITDILQMPFCSQESSVSDSLADADTSRNAPILTDFPSLALTQEEQSQLPNPQDLLLSSQECAPEPPKQIQIQRFLTVPSVIPLHGTLDEMHCPKCNHIEPLERYIEVLESGHSIHCPKCLERDFSRTALGERSRGVGVLKVSVVLYGEEHKQASRVGEIAEKDLLKAARPDVLLVAGTTLRIPGVKKIVKELAKVIKQPIREAIKDAEGNLTGEFTEREDPTKRVIFVNRDSPNPEKTWSEVFDTFVQGDAQAFAKLLRQEIQALKKPPPQLAVQAVPAAVSAVPLPSATATQPIAMSASAIVEEVAAAITARNNAGSLPVHVQTSLSDCWSVVKKGSSAPPAANQKPINNVATSVPSASELLSGAPIKLGDTLAFKSSKTKTIKVKGPKAPKEAKKVETDKQSQKEKLLTPKAPSPQLASTSIDTAASETAQVPHRPQEAAVKTKKNAVVKKDAVTKQRVRKAAKGKATKVQVKQVTPNTEVAPPVPTAKEKVKTKPGWRGYAELAEGEKYTPKFGSFFEDQLPEGSRRRRSTLPSQAQNQRAAPSVPSAKAELRETTPVSGAAGTSVIGPIAHFIFPPLKGSNWPNSAHPSVSSTPPSLDSDGEAFSDSDETASYKGEYEVSTSQETTCVPPTLSAEEATASLPSSLNAHATIESSSSPVIIEDTLSLEEAVSISAISSSQSPVYPTSGKNKRKASTTLQAGSFITGCSTAVKRTSRAPSTSKRMKIEA